MTSEENISALFHPRSIAILGCSEKNVGGDTLKNLLANHYTGGLYPVHPRNEAVHGVPCFKSLSDIPGEVDCCVVALRNTLLDGALDEMQQKGVKAAVLYASGFAETGAEGAALEKALAQKLQACGIAACGPNCLGFVNVNEGIPLYSAAIETQAVRGPVGIVSHSGSICIAFTSAARVAGYSYLVSCGNEAGLSVGDYFLAMADDPDTEVMLGFLETIRRPDSLIRAARRSVEVNKPILALTVGKGEVAQQTAAAHSGAMAGSYRMMDAFLERHHILKVNSFDDMNEASELFLKLKSGPLPKAGGVAMTAISGGQLGFCSDVAEDIGVRFADISAETVEKLRGILPGFSSPRNPLDVTTALFDPAAYKDCIRALAGDADVGLILVCQDCEEKMTPGEVDLYRHVIRALCEVRREIDTPMVVFSPLSAGLVPEFSAMLAGEGIPLLQGVHESMRAVKLYLEWSAIQKQHREGPVAQAENPPARPFDFGKTKNLSEHHSKELLKAYGIPVAPEHLVQTGLEAVKAADLLGYPVVVKVDSPDILHKTEAGVVRLNLQSAEQVRDACDEVLRAAAAYRPGAKVSGLSVQKMMTGAVCEMMLGVKVDPVFGPVLMVGVGGVFVEVFGDVKLGLAPVTRAQAAEMVEALKGKALLYGARGAPLADADALCEAIVALGRLAWDHRAKIAELDINPILVHKAGGGVVAVDALVVTNNA